MKCEVNTMAQLGQLSNGKYCSCQGSGLSTSDKFDLYSFVFVLI